MASSSYRSTANASRVPIELLREQYVQNFVEMNKLASEACASMPPSPAVEGSNFEEVNISHRFVLRSRGTLPAQRLSEAQNLFQRENLRINRLLSIVMKGDATSPGNVLLYRALITFFEE